MRKGCWIALALALLASPAVAADWWLVETNKTRAEFLDADQVKRLPKGEREATSIVIVPQGSRFQGRPVAWLANTYRFGCATASQRLLSGVANGLDGEVVNEISPDNEASPVVPASPAWNLMKLACADDEAERLGVGRKVGPASIHQLIVRYRPPAPR